MTQQLSPQARLGAFAVGVIAAAAFAAYFAETLSRYPDRNLPDELWRQARYFTILTTWLLAISFLAIAATGRTRAAWATGLTLWSAIVGVVYHLLLARDLTGLRWWTDQGLHTLVPIAVVLWWVLCAPKSGLRPIHAIWWLIWPGLYVAYALIRGEIDGKHPYFFIDPPLTGWPKVILWMIGLTAFFWISGLLAVFAGRWFNTRHPAIPKRSTSST